MEELIELGWGKLNIRVRKTEPFVYYATYISGEYNRIHIEENDIVIDAGANIGDFTIKAANLCQSGKVIALEPDPGSLQILRENIALNNLENVIILPYGLSDINGKAHLSNNNTTVSSTIMEEVTDSIQIETKTIQEILDTYCSNSNQVVLKMDIEGAEKLVFSNLKFLQKIRELSIELHGEDNVNNIPNILIAEHFKVYEFKLIDEVKNTLISFFSHPLSFISSERKTKWIAIKGLIKTLHKSNPIPSLSNPQFKLIYAKRTDAV